MNEAKKINSQDKLGWRMWLIVVLIGLAGQFAWSIENMYLNTFIAYLNFTAEPAEKFDYNLLIAVTTALSAITATLTTLLMGGLSDKYRKRKIFITIGYILWGISTASFGLLNVNNATGLLPISMSAMTAAIMVIVVDCIMTFFGSTGNDAAFNSFITKNISEKNRAKVEGVLGILPLIAMLIIFVGLNGLTTEASGYRWDLFFYIVGAIVLLVGIISAIKKDTLLDRFLMGFSLVGISLPVFWGAMLLQFIFGYKLGWLPISGYSTPAHMILPAVILGWTSSGTIARLTRSSLLGIMENDYIRTARAKGLDESLVVVKHGLKNAMIPVVTMMAMQFASLLSGAVITESVFGIGGIGVLMVSAVNTRDMPLLQGSVIFSTMIIIIGNLVADILYSFLDPKIREQ